MRKITRFLVGAAFGSLLGVSLAILLAPESGDNLRQDLRERSQALLDEIRQAAETRRIELRKQLDTLRTSPPQE